MDVIDELIANNRAFADSLPRKHLDVQPSRRLAIVTCMDSRLDVFAALGLSDGEAHDCATRAGRSPTTSSAPWPCPSGGWARAR